MTRGAPEILHVRGRMSFLTLREQDALWLHGAQLLGPLVISSSSKLDALLGTDTLGVQRVLDLTHLGDEVRTIDQRLGRVTAGDNQVQQWRLMGRDPLEHLGGIKPAEVQQIGELVQQENIERAAGDALLG